MSLAGMSHLMPMSRKDLEDFYLQPTKRARVKYEYSNERTAEQPQSIQNSIATQIAKLVYSINARLADASVKYEAVNYLLEYCFQLYSQVERVVRIPWTPHHVFDFVLLPIILTPILLIVFYVLGMSSISLSILSLFGIFVFLLLAIVVVPLTLGGLVIVGLVGFIVPSSNPDHSIRALLQRLRRVRLEVNSDRSIRDFQVKKSSAADSIAQLVTNSLKAPVYDDEGGQTPYELQN